MKNGKYGISDVAEMLGVSKSTVSRVINGNEGVGKPEALSGNLAGYWSRRINDKDRLIYKIDENKVYILACRYHYGEK